MRKNLSARLIFRPFLISFCLLIASGCGRREEGRYRVIEPSKTRDIVSALQTVFSGRYSTGDKDFLKGSDIELLIDDFFTNLRLGNVMTMSVFLSDRLGPKKEAFLRSVGETHKKSRYLVLEPSIEAISAGRGRVAVRVRLEEARVYLKSSLAFHKKDLPATVLLCREAESFKICSVHFQDQPTFAGSNEAAAGTYSNEAYGYSLSIPDGWKLKNEVGGEVQFKLAKDDKSTIAYLSAGLDGQERSIEDAVTDNIKMVKAVFPYFKIFRKGQEDFGTIKGVCVESRLKIGLFEWSALKKQVFFKEGQYIYELAVVSKDLDRAKTNEEFRKFIQGFSIKPSR